MIHFILVCLIGGLVGAGWGLAGAFALKIIQKRPKLPRWPIVTGLLLGLAYALVGVAG
ncbi:hypothetical protein [Brevundimonas sp. FT23042]|uniref:hypothetical protein n=1 Tax=Brevundimonas sp. FT23042 TaxID=3393749 RepID=UPI003B588F50